MDVDGNADIDGTVTVDRVINATTSSDPWLKGVNSSNTETAYIKPSGQAYFADKVGIGVASPNAVLHLGGTSPNLIFGGGGNALTYLQRYGADFYIYNKETNGALKIGTNNTERLRITSSGTLQLLNSPGIDFSGIQTNASGMSSETLDSYEEGTFIPSITGATQGTATLDSGVNTLAYTKIGRAVHITGRIRITSVSGMSGAVQLSNLPFQNASGLLDQSDYGLIHVYPYKTDLPSDALGTIFIELSQAGTTTGTFSYPRDDSNWPTLQPSAFDNGDVYLHINGTYITS